MQTKQDKETGRPGDKEKRSKGPGRVRDGLDQRQHELYAMQRFCGLVCDVRHLMGLASGETSPMAVRLRELARDHARKAREIYAGLSPVAGKGVAA